VQEQNHPKQGSGQSAPAQAFVDFSMVPRLVPFCKFDYFTCILSVSAAYKSVACSFLVSLRSSVDLTSIPRLLAMDPRFLDGVFSCRVVGLP
jgi:hypothetical protein